MKDNNRANLAKGRLPWIVLSLGQLREDIPIVVKTQPVERGNSSEAKQLGHGKNATIMGHFSNG
jgi:hypothetical protein